MPGRVPTSSGQAVFDLRRPGREDRSGYDAVALEAAEGTGQHLLGDAGRIALDLVKAAGTVAQQHDHEHAPFLAYAGEDSTHLLAILVQGMGQRGGHIRVPW
jgi:hypothetical protein